MEKKKLIDELKQTRDVILKENNLGIISNEKINNTNVYKMTIAKVKNNLKPGQFVNVKIPNVFLPRPISVADYSDANELTLIYRVVGEGTEIMSTMKKDDNISILSGLGNGFNINEVIKKPLVIGGGLGAAPLYYLTKKLVEKGLDPKVILGFASEEDAFYLEEYLKLVGNNLEITYDSKGKLVTDPMKNLDQTSYDYFYACGPKPMLKAVESCSITDGELSLETRMACGIGMCKCCSQETLDGMKTLCHDGPVLKKGIIRW